MFIAGPKGRLLLIILAYIYAIVSILEIKLSENFSS